MKRLKHVPPSLREKKRYLAFEIISKQPILNGISEAMNRSVLELLGTIGASECGLMSMPKKYDAARQRGIVRINHKYGDKVRASFMFITKIGSQECIVRSLGSSGMLTKACEYIKEGKNAINEPPDNGL